MSKKDFIVHESTILQATILTDDELGRLFRAQINYHTNEELPDKDDRLIYSIFIEWKRRYDKDKAKYEAVCKRNRENGAKSNGAPLGNQNARRLFDDVEQPKTTQNNPKQPSLHSDSDNGCDNDCDGDNINDIKKEKVEKRNVFVRPKIEEVDAYIKERGYHFDAETFFNFYESKGWMVGSNHMKDWKAACRTWESKRKNEANPSSAAEAATPEELPAGLTPEKWANAMKWLTKHAPRICRMFSPNEFMTMKAIAHHKSGVFSDIIVAIDKSDYTGDIVSEFRRLACDEPYVSMILSNG